MLKKIITIIILLTITCSSACIAKSYKYTIKPGDTMWKIAVKNQTGLSELIKENPHIKNPALIYPGQVLNIPDIKDIKGLETKVVWLVNKERKKYGLSYLKENWELSRIARYKSKDMINKHYFSHYSPTYGSPFTMIQNFGLRYYSAGENIAYGMNSPEAVMKGWLNSPGHRSNILSSSYSQIGVGLAIDKNGRYYWTQMFIRPY